MHKYHKMPHRSYTTTKYKVSTNLDIHLGKVRLLACKLVAVFSLKTLPATFWWLRNCLIKYIVPLTLKMTNWVIALLRTISANLFK